MKRTKRLIVRITFVVTLCMTAGFAVKGYQLNKLIKRVDHQIASDKKELSQDKKQLKKLESEVAQMNTPEYIEKVAREELGMVKEDDIVFREKQ